jgi:hypothetical protein
MPNEWFLPNLGRHKEERKEIEKKRDLYKVRRGWRYFIHSQLC